MKLRLIMVFLYLNFFTTSIFSQVSNSAYLSLKEVQFESTSSDNLFFFCRKKYIINSDKSPPLWKQSILLTTTGDTLFVMARLLLEKDQIEILLGDNPCILFQEKTRAIAIDKRVFIHSEYPYKDQLFLGYFELINEGKILLLKKGGDFFYKKEGLPAKKIKRTKKGIYQISIAHHKEIEKLIRSKDLNIKNDTDLTMIFQFINNSPLLTQK